MVSPLNQDNGDSIDSKGSASSSENLKAGRWRNKLRKLVDWVLLVAVFGVMALALLPKSSALKKGTQAPALQLPLIEADLKMKRQNLIGDRERPLLIKAFASWCSACRRDNGVLQGLADARKAGLLDVLAVSVDDSPALALAAKKEWPIEVNVLFDDRGSFSRNYHVDVLPTYILVGKSGKIRRVTPGRASASDVRAWLKLASN